MQLGVPRSFFTFCVVAAAALAIVMSARVTPASAQAASAASRSTRDGVYTMAQAERGKTVFDISCSSCHTARMWSADWNSGSIADVYDFIGQYMPQDNPATLTAQQLRDVIAFLLEANNLPAGQTELPETADAMKAIRMEKPAS
jgi:mono/diheme cytochrome c family protein